MHFQLNISKIYHLGKSNIPNKRQRWTRCRGKNPNLVKAKRALIRLRISTHTYQEDFPLKVKLAELFVDSTVTNGLSTLVLRVKDNIRLMALQNRETNDPGLTVKKEKESWGTERRNTHEQHGLKSTTKTKKSMENYEETSLWKLDFLCYRK